ncbi:MAG: hypothetical protein JJ897_14405 [Marinibacterium sp.]|nr:hypothetical protein [Marinibacterium sp.]
MSDPSVMRAGLLAVAAISAQPVLADCTRFDELDAFAEIGVASAEANCKTYLTSNAATGTACHWAFPFREDAARSFAEVLWSDLMRCRTGAALGPNAQVNHPDSYDLREWQTSPAIYAMSVKDKGGLNRTLVFLRTEPRKP